VGSPAGDTRETSGVPVLGTTHGPAFVRQLLRPGAIRTHFQPIARLGDGAVVGYEALSRAREAPDAPPDSWLADADTCGLGIDVQLACMTAAAAYGPPPFGALLFVNASPAVLLDERFQAISSQFGPHVIEVTEHEPVQDYDALVRRLEELAIGGTLLAIDDVGAGYANMAHVLQLNPAYIKIDRSLVSGLHQDRRRQALVGAFVAFARAVGATTIAEGVESVAELEAARDLGVDLGQGFLLGRPAPPWSSLLSAAHAVLAPSTPVGNAMPGGLQELRLALTQAHPSRAADLVTDHLARNRQLLPSVYLERGGVLRCVARKGQWLVLDGIRPGAGITGAAFADREEILAQDVRADTRYVAALPGVRSELAVPLRVGGQVVGVLNVDSLSQLSPSEAVAIRQCAGLIEQRLDLLFAARARPPVTEELASLAARIASAPTIEKVAFETAEAASIVTGFDTACVWQLRDGVRDLVAEHGPNAHLLRAVDAEQLADFAAMVDNVACCFSGGAALDLSFGPTDVLRQRGVRAVILVAVRDGNRVTGLMIVTSSNTATAGPEAINAVEVLSLHAGSRMASLQRQQALQELAYLDPLCGVGNRTWFEERIDRGTGRRHVAGWLAVFDIDRFKSVNDAFGHETGDRALREVAQALSEGALPAEVFRLGGDEFAVLVEGQTESAVVEELGERRRRASAQLSPYGADLSCGMTATGDNREDLRDALYRADQALYRQKRAGGGNLMVG
jgi:diguanylate cyclase (GGDEF)-like protein